MKETPKEARARRLKERRFDEFGPFRALAEAEGYLMARRHGRPPTIMTVAKWESLEHCRDNVVPITTPVYDPGAQTGMGTMEELREVRRQAAAGEITPAMAELRRADLIAKLQEQIT